VKGARGTPNSARRFPWRLAGIVAGVLLVCVAAFVLLRHDDAPMKSAPDRRAPIVPAAATSPTASDARTAPAAATAADGSAPLASPGSAKSPAPVDEQVDQLIEKAQHAMLDRHFIDPADGSALTLYRGALLLSPDNGEARQGLQRLAEILIARVQSALDERKIDVALQSLETARSINPGDGRLPALDERIAALRAEIGPAQILATINAQNFDRAGQLIDEAARTKSLAPAKLTQLREELRRRHAESDVANLAKLIDSRLQQDKVIAPYDDSAAHYLSLARAAGASAASLQAQSLEINKRLTATLHAAIDQRRFADADRLIADMRTAGVASATIATLQHDLSAARNPPAPVPTAPEQAHYVDADAVQAQIVEQARAAIDTPPAAKSELPEVVEASLTHVKGVAVDYPAEALRKNIEGWVELSFTVTAEGKVTKIAVTNSSPKGIFDAAAAAALARVRYKPPMPGGKVTAVTTQLRIAFRLPK
jgi:TonB family protein